MTESNDPMAEIRASFFIECDELLEALQDGLQQLEEGADDPETINIVFRAVHSIKGGAGAFGLERLVRFAHRYETVLDEVRGGKLSADSEAQKLFYQAADHLSDLVRMSRDGEEIADDASDALIEGLNALIGEEEEEEVQPADFQPLGVAISLDLPDLDAPAPVPSFTVVFKPGQELFATGNEPQMLLRNLCALGDATVTCHRGDLPPLDQLAPETPYFHWEVLLTADVAEAEIREVFEFVEGLCELEITQNDAPVTDTLPELPDLPEPEAEPEPTPAKAPPPRLVAETPLPEETEDTAPQPALDKAPAAKPSASSGTKSVVRVDLERIERLVNLVGELVINQAMLTQSLDKWADHCSLPPESGHSENRT